MTRLQIAGRWVQVLAGVLAWILFVPLIELARVALRRLGRTDGETAVERETGSRSPVASAHPRRAA